MTGVAIGREPAWTRVPVEVESVIRTSSMAALLVIGLGCSVIVTCLLWNSAFGAAVPDSTASHLHPDNGEALQLLERVDHFYAAAWERLTLYVTIALGVVGIALPVGITLIQRRQLKMDEEKLRRRLTARIESLGKELESRVEKRREEMSREIAKLMVHGMTGLNQKNEHTTAGVLIVQGTFALRVRDFKMAHWSHARSIEAALRSGDDEQVGQCIANLIQVLNLADAAEARQDLFVRQCVADAVAALRSSEGSSSHAAAIEAIERAMVLPPLPSAPSGGVPQSAGTSAAAPAPPPDVPRA